MIIEITQKLSELDVVLEQIDLIVNSGADSNIYDLLELMAKFETNIMDFNLLFKRLPILEKQYKKLNQKYIEQIFPKANNIINQ